MNCENQSFPLWDSNHDWILQFDNILKTRQRSTNVEYTRNSRVKDNVAHINGVYEDTPDGKPVRKSLRDKSESY